MLLLFLPFNPSQARRKFFAVFFVVCYTLATLPVTRTGCFSARTIYVIMWTGHGGIYFCGITSVPVRV